MMTRFSSRDRILAALECRKADYVPCYFSAFQSLRQQCADQSEFLDRQLAMGLDAVVVIPSVSLRHDSRVRIREWSEDLPGEAYPVLHKEYETPVGKLNTAVNKSEDWPWGDHVPFMDGFLIPRSRAGRGQAQLPGAVCGRDCTPPMAQLNNHRLKVDGFQK